MQAKSIRKTASALKIQKQAFLNDTYHWVEIARKAVQQLPPEQFEFEVPKAKRPEENHVVVRHHPEKVKARIMNKDLYASAFVSSVAAVEDYLYKIIELFLLEDTRRIKCTIQGISMTNSVSVVDLIDKSKEELIHRVIEERLASVFYASPQKQLEYLDKAIGLKVPVDEWENWIEIKARRDLWVHNGGIINQIYLDKAKTKATGAVGTEATITQIYFRGSIAKMKRFVGCIDTEIRKMLVGK